MKGEVKGEGLLFTIRKYSDSKQTYRRGSIKIKYVLCTMLNFESVGSPVAKIMDITTKKEHIVYLSWRKSELLQTKEA